MSVDKQSTLWVTRGLYVLRYDSGASDSAPLAFVAAPGAERSVEIVSAPGAEPGCLSGPGEALVIRAHEPVNLSIGVRRKTPQGSLEASLKLETLSATPAALPAPEPQKVSLAKPSSLFIAHVAKRGDLEIRTGDWAAGPDAPARIEGLEPLPTAHDGVQFEIQTLSAGAEWSPWTGAGAFAGTRGRNLPLIGLRLRLSGPESNNYWLTGDALFIGAPVLNQRGRELEFLSPSGSDALVGLRLDIRRERRLIARNANEPRVRVFKAAVA